MLWLLARRLALAWRLARGLHEPMRTAALWGLPSEWERALLSGWLWLLVLLSLPLAMVMPTAVGPWQALSATEVPTVTTATARPGWKRRGHWCPDSRAPPPRPSGLLGLLAGHPDPTTAQCSAQAAASR